MKFKCKECNKKFKCNSREEIDCSDSTCRTKYNMKTQMLDFKDYKLDYTYELIDEIKSPYTEPVYNQNIQWSDDQWELWANNMGY